MDNPAETLLEAIERVREGSACYSREAYLFVVAALGHAVAQLPQARRDDPVQRHLSGGEVIAAMIDLARIEFGPLAAAVLSEWGVTHGRDVGVIVFELVDAGQLSTQPDDCIEDFDVPDDLLAAGALDPSARRSTRDAV